LRRAPCLILAFALPFSTLAPAQAQVRSDETPRIAVISAFGPELTALEQAATDKHVEVAGGVAFTTGVLDGKPVVLFLSGMSMVNAAMTTQRALDRFHISRIVFSGIAGGVDPDLDVGDVVVADQWGQYLESAMARQTAPGKYEPPPSEPMGDRLAPFGMMFPRPVQVTLAPGVMERRQWFPADPAMVATARTLIDKVTLKRCVADRCLTRAPKVVVGGNGVSGQAFVDNAELRTWAFATFHARVLDMESAAVAQVAYVNGTPFIAFRSLSDLAGGDPSQNQWRVFVQLASDNSAAVVRAFIDALP
jgi:adenosylhomocysteine nucleosidase